MTENTANVFADENKKTVKKRAYFAMCRVTVFLFVLALLSYAFSYLLNFLLYTYSAQLQKALVDFVLLFGVGKTVAVSAVKRLLMSGAFSCFAQLLSGVVTLVLPAVIYAKCENIDGNDSFPVKGRLVKGFWRNYGVMQLLVMTAGAFSTTIYDFFFPESTVDPGGFTDLSGSDFDVYTLIMRIIVVCVFVPVAEEYVFRGVLFGVLRKYGTMFGVVASAAAFGIAHSNPSQSVYAFVFGLYSAFLVALTGNIKTSVLFHAINNLVSVTGEHLMAFANENAISLFNSFHSMLAVMFGFAGFYLLAKKDGLVQQFSKKCSDERKEKGDASGMKQIAVVPLVVYALIYAVDIIGTAV